MYHSRDNLLFKYQFNLIQNFNMRKNNNTYFAKNRIWFYINYDYKYTCNNVTYIYI